MGSGLRSPPFTQEVVRAMQALYPEELADRRWDNVGLLLGNLDPTDSLSPVVGKKTSPIVLLTIDLTLAVAEEAIRKQASVIVTYHPFIFRGLKSVTLDDAQQSIAILLAQHNIAVYSPHTALDAAPGGLNDALAYEIESLADDRFIPYETSVLQPVPALPSGYDASKCGYGRLVTLQKGVELDAVIMAYERLLNPLGQGHARYIMLARPNVSAESKGRPSMVQSVAVCAGSGYDVLKDCGADLLVTGEMTHHNALKATMQGQFVLTFFHSNSERFFLEAHLRSQLRDQLKEQGWDTASVFVSEKDKDPFEIVEIGA